ncbi:hypothetical protein FRC12_012780 [Ceratobasidium sp. 428]|nr:hypothetical protein FRC12_012780 [Ceratobasidium sp. 428]
MASPKQHALDTEDIPVPAASRSLVASTNDGQVYESKECDYNAFPGLHLSANDSNHTLTLDAGTESPTTSEPVLDDHIGFQERGEGEVYISKHKPRENSSETNNNPDSLDDLDEIIPWDTRALQLAIENDLPELE